MPSISTFALFLLSSPIALPSRTVIAEKGAKSRGKNAASLALAASFHSQYRSARMTAGKKYLNPKLEIPNKTLSPKSETRNRLAESGKRLAESARRRAYWRAWY
jgi:hypothetical protein